MFHSFNDQGVFAGRGSDLDRLINSLTQHLIDLPESKTCYLIRNEMWEVVVTIFRNSERVYVSNSERVYVSKAGPSEDDDFGPEGDDA